MQSRLSRASENKTKHQLVLSLVAIIIVLFVLFKFGIPALTSLSLFLSSKNVTPNSVPTSTAVVAPPLLDQPYTATNSATITVSGTADQNETIQLYVDSTLVDSQPTDSNGSFKFTGVALTQQQNTIQAKAKTADNRVSDSSDTWNVSYIQKAPSLTIDSPHNGDNFDSSHPTVVVSGKTDPNIQVTVNGFWAIVDNNGNYSYNLTLSNGSNQITVIATDAAGNTSQQQISVNHSQ